MIRPKRKATDEATKPKAGLSYERWEERFDAAAEHDEYSEMDWYCQFVGCGVEGLGEPIMSGTKQMMWWLGGVDWFWPDYPVDGAQRRLRMQTYDPTKAKGARYVIGVESRAFGWARLIWDDVCFSDLADFHGDYTLRSLVVSKPNGGRMSERDHRRITHSIEEDLHFGHGAEVKVSYRWDSNCLRATVCGEEDEFPTICPGMTIAIHRENRGTVEGIVRSGGPKRLRVTLRGERRLKTVPVKDVWYSIERA